QCQRLFDSGAQCGHQSEVVHHLVDPTVAPHKAHDWTNLVAVCYEHHPGGQQGETMGYRYCATVGPHAIHYHPGGLLPTWHKDYVKPTTGDVSRLAGTTTSAVGGARIDAALAGLDVEALLDGV